MPTYEYICKECDYEFDAFQSMKDDLLKECPECNELRLKRKIGSGAGLLFKGSGFYCTDYRSDSYNKAKKNDKNTLNSNSKSSKSKTKKATNKTE